MRSLSYNVLYLMLNNGDNEGAINTYLTLLHATVVFQSRHARMQQQELIDVIVSSVIET